MPRQKEEKRAITEDEGFRNENSKIKLEKLLNKKA